MQKLLLFTFFLLLAGAGTSFAQESTTPLTGENRTHQPAQIDDQNETTAPRGSFQPPANYMVIDSLLNGFSYYTLNAQPFTYDPVSNAYVTIKRAGSGNSGEIFLRLSLDGGATWEDPIGPLHNTETEGGPGRYPSVAIANPTGATDQLGNIFAVYMFPALVTSPTTGFGNMVYGLATLDGNIVIPLGFSTGIDGSTWLSSTAITTVNNDAAVIGAGALNADNFGVVSVTIETGAIVEQIPSSLASSNFRPGTAEGRFSSLIGLGSDNAGTAYLLIHAWADEITGLRPAFTTSSDAGATWSDLNWAPESLIDNYTTSLGASPDSGFIGYDGSMVVTGQNSFSTIANYFANDDAAQVDESHLIEIRYDNGSWSLHKVADISGLVPLFFHDESGVGTQSQLGNEIQLVRTADGSSIIAKWMEFVSWISETDITGDGVAPDTLTTADIFISGRNVATGSWSAPVNVTESLIWDKMSWLPNIVPTTPDAVPMLLSQSMLTGSEPNDSARFLHQQRSAISAQYLVVTQVDAAVTLSVPQPGQQRDVLSMQTYPNPTTDEVRLDFAIEESGSATIEVFNASGDRVMQLDTDHVTVGTHSLPLNVSTLPAGSYYCRVTSSGSVSVGGFSVVR